MKLRNLRWEFSTVAFIASSTSKAITCSPKAEVKCLVLPETKILCGFLEIKRTTSPIEYAQSPEFVVKINA